MSESPTRVVDGATVPTAGTYALDPSHSHVGFKVRHVMVSKVRGSFSDVAGTVVIAEDPLASTVEVTVQTASFDTNDEQRDGHVRSADFLDVETYPTLTFRSTGVESKGGDDYVVRGELTVRDTTEPVELALTFDGAGGDPWGGTRLGFSAKAKIDREDFGLTWNQALETGGVLVGKAIEIEIEAEAVRQ